MAWLQIKMRSTADDAEYFAQLLQQCGALSVTFLDAADQPIYEPGINETPLWQATDIIALYPAEIDIHQLASHLQALSSRTIPELRADPLEDKDWVRAWMDHYQPMHFGGSLWIVPSHCEPPHPQATNLLLDPGLAFGTGTHPTTAMCLRWLAVHPPLDQHVIDYGCGSGILAIAAAKLGATQVDAIDNDPQALLATTRNAQRNAVQDRIHCGLPGKLTLRPSATLLANILANPLMELAPLFANLVETGGNIVLSGILQTQAKQILEIYRNAFQIDIVATQEDWVCLAGQRH